MHDRLVVNLSKSGEIVLTERTMDKRKKHIEIKMKKKKRRKNYK